MNFKIGLVAMLVLGTITSSRAQLSNLLSSISGKPKTPVCHVVAFNVDGNTVLSAEKLDFLTNYTGASVDLARMREGLSKLQLLYRNLGFATASVTLPQQHLTNGIVRIRVIEGKFDKHSVALGATTDSLLSTNSVKPKAPTFRVTAYDIEGNTVLPENKFDFLTNYTGPAVTIALLREGLGALQLLYRNLGFATVSITLPQQRLTNGIVQVKVIEGELAEISVTGNHYYSSNNIRTALPSLKTNILINSKWLQQEIDRANQNPDRQIYPIVSPDAEPGFTDLTLRVKDRLPLHGHMDIDDKSTPETPLLRINTALQYNNLWQVNHQVGLQYNFSPQSMKADNYLPRFYDQPMVASYSSYYRIPIGSGGSLREDYERLPVDFGYNEVTHQFHLPQPSGNPELIVYASRSSSDQPVRYGPLTTVIDNPLVQITSQSAERDLTFTENIGAKYTVPLKEIAGVHPSMILGFDFKSYRLQSFSTNLSYVNSTITNNGVAGTSNSIIALPANSHQAVTYMPLSLALSGDRPDALGTFSFNLEEDLYLDHLESSKPNFQVVTGSANAGGDYTKFTGSVTREETLPAGWSILGLVAGQWASEPLINNEEFPLGGTAGVRGYQEGEAYGDTGWETTFDLRAPAVAVGSFPVNGGESLPGMLRPSLFMDYGEVYLLDRAGASALPEWGTGLGLFLTAGEHVDARLSLGWALLRTPVSTPGSLQAYFSVGFQF